MSTETLAYHPPTPRPAVAVERDPAHAGMFRAVCLEDGCPWTEGPSVKSYMQQRATAHRQQHRAGRVPLP